MFVRKELAIIDGPNLLRRPAGFSIVLVEHEKVARLLEPQSDETASILWKTARFGRTDRV
jgi:hypothetical protein